MIANIEAKLNETIINRRVLSRAATGTVSHLTTESGKNFILKSTIDPCRAQCEAAGLREIMRAKSLSVPSVFFQEEGFLLTAYISSLPPGAHFFEKFGRSFAAMHRFTANSFGFYEDNFIGATPQKNIPDNKAQRSNWVDFFMEKRLLFQYKRAEKTGHVTPVLREAFFKLAPMVPEILSGSEEPPALLHGDLWSGNFISGADGQAWVIDPAVYYGHREADLVMTELFGGFPRVFYDAYQECYPLKDGYECRKRLYKLYHILNHLNIFGMGYQQQALALMQDALP